MCGQEIPTEDGSAQAVIRALRPHVASHCRYGDELLSVIQRADAPQPLIVELPYPTYGIAVDRGAGSSHAARPGPMTIDGHAAGLCDKLLTIAIATDATGQPRRATPVRQGFGPTRQPRCGRCRHILKYRTS